MENQNVLSSIEQLKIDNSNQVLSPKNNSNNNHRNNNHRNNNHRNNNYRNNNYRNNNNNNNNRNNNNRRNQYNEDEDPELLLAFEISKAEYEEQQKKNNNNPTSTTTTTTNNTSTTPKITNNINSNNSSSINLDNKKGKKGQVDMTHLLKFQSTSPHHRSPYINSPYSPNSSSSNVNSNSYRPPRSFRNNTNSNNNNNNSNNNNSYNKNKNNNNKFKKPIQDSTFLQANYLFKINPFGNYTTTLREIDHLVSWKQVEQVIYLNNEDTQFQCPICLDEPVTPKITKCGHILCYACILRSLSHTNKCPLCLLPIESKLDLKSLEFRKTKKFNDGDEITLQLIKYQDGCCTVPFLSDQSIPDKISFPNNEEKNSKFSRFTIISSIDDIIEKEMDQVIHSRETALSECESESLKFLSEALESIQTRQESFKKLLNSRYSEGQTYITVLKNQTTNKNKKEFDHYQCSNNFEIRMALEEYFNQPDQSIDDDYNTPDSNYSDDDSISNNYNINGDDNSTTTTNNTTTTTTTTTTNSIPTNVTPNLNILGKPINNPISNGESTSLPNTSISELNLESFSYENQPSNGLYYLYQSNDGQKIYLHPLCMKILDYEFKKANQLPSTLKAKVYEFEDYQVTNQSRKQYQSFNVIALTTTIRFAEIDLSSIVSKETLQHFSKEIKQRKDARLNKKRKEQRVQRVKELERAKDLERALELREISRKEREEQLEKERQQLEKAKKEREEQLKNPVSKSKKQLGFLEAIQSHHNIDSVDEFPSLGPNNS